MRRAEPVSYRVATFILDRVIARARFILWPFALLTRIARVVGALVWLLSNEYQKSKFGRCGTGVRIYGRFFVSCPERLEVGDNVHINSNAFLRAEGGLRIDDNVHISRNLLIYTINHNYEGESLPYDSTVIARAVHIERNVWIGSDVIVTPGVTVGHGAIIGMGSVIAKDVAPLSIVGTAPQRVLKLRDRAHYEEAERAGRYGGMSGHRFTRRGPRGD
jgi:maltose O-acetyltransferase